MHEMITHAWRDGCRPADAPHRALERTDSPSQIHLFGVPINRVSSVQALERVEAWIAARSATRLVMTPDTTALMRARWDASLRQAYQEADLVTADGTGIVWAARLFGEPLLERVTGIDLLEAFCERSHERRYRLFCLGARPGVALAAARALTARFPSLQVVGTHHGYFRSYEERRVVRRINRVKPDLLLVGLGVPFQERWMVCHRGELEVPVVMGVGGSFDVLSGRRRRAPQTWQTLGLEWLWRALGEPRRFWRARAIPLFLLNILSRKLLGLVA